MKIDLKSLLAGAMIGAGVMLSVAAAKNRPPIPELSGLRFVILNISRDVEPVSGKQRAVLRLARFYGKIDGRSLDFRLKNETQELKLVTSLDAASTVQTNEIISLEAFEDMKLGPGESVVTHVPPVTPK